jgi:hypothetical protein
MVEQRFRPARESQTGDTVEPRQRFLRVSPMKVNHSFIARHYCFIP